MDDFYTKLDNDSLRKVFKELGVAVIRLACVDYIEEREKVLCSPEQIHAQRKRLRGFYEFFENGWPFSVVDISGEYLVRKLEESIQNGETSSIVWRLRSNI